MGGHNEAMGRRAFGPTFVADVELGTASLVPDPDRLDGWLLLVDGTQQSYVDLSDPRYLPFEYTRWIGHVIDQLPDRPVRALHLGGGAMSLPRYLGAARPGSRSLVVEADARLVDFVRAHLPWPASDRIRVRVAEARATVATLTDGSRDLVILDVFDRARTPAPLTTREALADMRRVLTADGILVANLADRAPLAYSRRVLAGIAELVAGAGGELLVVTEPAVLRGRRFGNLVAVARTAGAPRLDPALLTRRCAGDPWPARVLGGDAVRELLAHQSPFTDEDAASSPEPPRAGLFDR